MLSLTLFIDLSKESGYFFQHSNKEFKIGSLLSSLFCAFYIVESGSKNKQNMSNVQSKTLMHPQKACRTIAQESKAKHFF